MTGKAKSHLGLPIKYIKFDDNHATMIQQFGEANPGLKDEAESYRLPSTTPRHKTQKKGKPQTLLKDI